MHFSGLERMLPELHYRTVFGSSPLKEPRLVALFSRKMVGWWPDFSRTVVVAIYYYPYGILLGAHYYPISMLLLSLFYSIRTCVRSQGLRIVTPKNSQQISGKSSSALALRGKVAGFCGHNCFTCKLFWRYKGNSPKKKYNLGRIGYRWSHINHGEQQVFWLNYFYLFKQAHQLSTNYLPFTFLKICGFPQFWT